MKKTEFIGAVLMTVIGAGLGIPLMIMAFISLFFKKKDLFIVNDRYLTPLAIDLLMAGLVIGGGYKVRKFLIEIRKSKERMKDEKYCELLRSLKLIP